MQNMYRFMHLSSQTNLLLEPLSGEECLLSRMMKPGTPARPGRPAQTRGPRRTGTHQDSIETKDCSRTCICGRGLGSGKLWRAENWTFLDLNISKDQYQHQHRQRTESISVWHKKDPPNPFSASHFHFYQASRLYKTIFIIHLNIDNPCIAPE